MNTFVTHPSVRIKGTENNYNPVRCIDPNCPDHSLHMHCPFCVKTEFYHDPVILKAHFRVKHVDKGIDFAGLKILRCGDHCDIVGIIKGEKKFKGAHWHCYKCRNGFNRRDEAIKHYKTHFRNPQTTFQIQIAQEINSQVNSYNESISGSTATLDQSGLSIHPALTQAVMSTSLSEGHSLLNNHSTHVSMSNGKSADGTVHVSVAANETVDSTDPPTHHIMIIQEEPSDTAGGDSTYTTQIISGEDVGIAEEKEQADHQNSDNRYEELQQKYHQALIEKSQQEQQLNSEIDHLRSQVYSLKAEIRNLQKREQELLEQISVPLDKNIESLLKQLEVQHRDLLHQQLLCIKRQYIPQIITTCNGPRVQTATTEDSSISTADKELITNNTAIENTEDEESNDLSKNDMFKNNSVAISDDKMANSPEDSGKGSSNENANIVVVNEMSLSDNSIESKLQESRQEMESVKPDSGPYVVCIEYNSLPLDETGNLHVTQDLNLDESVNNTGENDEPLPKRVKHQ